jgi:Bacterial SH3 domain
MKYSITIFFMLIATFLFSQESEFDIFAIVKASKLSIRAKPDIKAEKIGSMNNGDLVKILERNVKLLHKNKEEEYDLTIDNITDTWIKIQYKGIIGFAFGGYLAFESIRTPNKPFKDKYLFAIEGQQSGTWYSEDLKWYGIYNRSDGEYIEQVRLKFESVIDDENNGTNNTLKISTDRKELARILVGTNEPIKLGKVGISITPFYDRITFNERSIPIPAYTNDNSIINDYLLYAKNWVNKKENCFVENYSLTFCSKYINSPINYLHTFQEMGNFDECNIPYLFWFGDMNGDEVPDFIFLYISTKFNKYKIYFSKKSDEKITFEKAIDFMPEFEVP